MKFQDILKIVLDNEGGYCFISGDKGGETYCGVARNFQPNWEGWKIIDEIKSKRKTKKIKYNEKLKEIKIEMLEEFYKKNFWEPIKGDSLLEYDSLLCAHVFDMAVNAGTRKASKMLQQCINTYADGIIGAITLSRLSAIREKEKLNIKYAYERKVFYKAIAIGENLKFLDGWIRRVEHITESIQKLLINS